MKVVYYTSARTGSGHIVLGLSVYNGLKRCGGNFDFTILACSSFTELAGRLGVPLVPIPYEDEHQLCRDRYEESQLYRKLQELQPDVLIVDLSWFTLHYFIDELSCRKIFLCRQISDSAFTIPLQDAPLIFNSRQYDQIFAIEPFPSKVRMERLNPIVIRNRDEILPREEACRGLDLRENEGDFKVCLFAFNGKPGEFEEKKKTYSYLENEGYRMIYTTNFQGGLFPAVDYFNAADLLISGAGYNAYWEAMYFEKDVIFIPLQRRFESQRLRVETCAGYRFSENGADQLARELLI